MLPAGDGLQAVAPPRAGRLAVAVQRNVVSGGVAVRQYAAPDVAPWLAAPPGGPWPVAVLAVLPALRLDPVARPFHVHGRVLGRTR